MMATAVPYTREKELSVRPMIENKLAFHVGVLRASNMIAWVNVTSFS